MAKFTCNFISYTLKRTVDITVIIPSTTIPESMGMVSNKEVTGDNENVQNLMLEKPQCTHEKEHKYPVVYLLHGMGNNHAQWTGYTNVELFAEERNIAIVNISAENKSYVNIGGDNFYDFIENELQSFVTGMFPVSKRPEIPTSHAFPWAASVPLFTHSAIRRSIAHSAHSPLQLL